jgi:hypothetical protein
MVFRVNVLKYPCQQNANSGSMTVSFADPRVPAGAGVVVSWYSQQDGSLQGTGFTLLNAVALTYNIVAISEIFGCSYSVAFTLTIHPPPTVNFLKKPIPGMPTLDNVVGNAISSNGPPYNVTIYGIPTLNGPNSWDPQLRTSLSGNVLQFQINGVPVIQSFDVIVTDSGGCVALASVPGGQVTEEIIIPSQSKFPNNTVPFAAKKRAASQIFFLFMFVMGGIVVVFVMMLLLFGTAQKSIQDEIKQAKTAKKTRKEKSGQ